MLRKWWVHMTIVDQLQDCFAQQIGGQYAFEPGKGPYVLTAVHLRALVDALDDMNREEKGVEGWVRYCHIA